MPAVFSTVLLPLPSSAVTLSIFNALASLTDKPFSLDTTPILLSVNLDSSFSPPVIASFWPKLRAVSLPASPPNVIGFTISSFRPLIASPTFLAGVLSVPSAAFRLYVGAEISPVDALYLESPPRLFAMASPRLFALLSAAFAV